MSVAASDLGVLGNLAVALGVFTPAGDPNPDWFAAPEDSLRDVLANEAQREALLAFVDEALGGEERAVDARGVVWLPVVELDDPDLTVAVTVDDTQADAIHVGLGLIVRTSGPRSATSLAVPLFRTRREDGPTVPDPLLLGTTGGRIRIATSITIDDAPPVPGQARLGAIGVDIDVPTALGDPAAAVFGITLAGFQLPGAAEPRDVRVAADGAEALDDALLDLVLSLVRTQADGAAAPPRLAALGGLLGLRSGDAIPDFPIAQLPTQGAQALAAWLYGIITTPSSRGEWVGYLASLLGGTRVGDAVAFSLGGAAELTLGLRVDTGPTGNARLTPTLGVELGDDDARVEARADLFRVDLVTGAASALPQLGVWAAAGRAGDGNRVLDVTSPAVVRADTLRLGFALDAERRLTFVLAADGVVLGSQTYATLDLTSPDAVMDAVGNTVGDVANQLLAGAGDALGVVRLLLGVDAPSGVTAVPLASLLGDPVGAVSGYWRELVSAPPAAMQGVLAALRDALADASEAASAIRGSGTAPDPWRVPLVGPLALELWASGPLLSVGVAATTSVDTLGQRCTVIETRLAATIAELDLDARTASLLPAVEGALAARERGVSPPRVALPLADGALLSASGVGLRLRWTPSDGLAASVPTPDLALEADGVIIPIALPVVAADGSVTLPPEAWDGVEALVGHLGALLGGVLGDVVTALGWLPERRLAGGDDATLARLPLADLVADPRAALAAWLPALAMSDAGAQALALVADLFRGAGLDRGFVLGTGHPDDPYRFALADTLPDVAVWFPPAGLERQVVAAPESVRGWRPGQPGLDGRALAAALRAEAAVAADVRALVEGRDVADGLDALARRWVGGDGRVVPPESAPAGITVDRAGIGYAQLLAQLDLEDLTGRVPGTTVYVAIGTASWRDAPADRVVDLTAPRLEASMFTVPAPATGSWFVALATRADALVPGSTTDGTPEQAARLARMLDALAGVSSDVAVVALGGAGHAARLAAEAQAAVTDLVTLGTPLAPLALTAIATQPTADALRLLHRLLPAPLPPGDDPELEREDDDLALGRALVGAMMELADRADPGAELRQPVVPPPAPRAGLAVTAQFGVVTAEQVSRAITAIVVAGLAERARRRVAVPLPAATGVRAGLRLAIAPSTAGTLEVTGDALLSLLAYDTATGVDDTRTLRVRLRVRDRVSWLSATPDLELRMVTTDVTIPLGGSGPGTATVTLHDARVFGESWERLVLGNVDAALPVLPEARVLLAAAVQRIREEEGGSAAALQQLLAALGLTSSTGALVGDALDQLVHDPGGLVRQRLAAEGAALAAAVNALLGPLGASVDLAARTVRVNGGSATSGRFGWHADVTAGPGGVGGALRVGADGAPSAAGSLQAVVQLRPLAIALHWRQPGGAAEVIPLWPEPDAVPIARAIAKAAPSLAAHVALELMRRADESARPVIDAALDAMGMLAGAAGDAERAVRPLAGLLADPAGWLRSADALGASPAKMQALLDALRPLLGVGGAPGSPVALANGVALTVAAEGAGARLTLAVDPGAWAAPAGGTARLAAGLGASLAIGPSGPPAVGIAAHVGLTGAPAGRQAIHVQLGAGGIRLFARPTSGADVSLVPFNGLGSLAAAAEMALPFLLDQLAAAPDPVGPLVSAVGDALALRGGTPRRFDATALRAWAANPAGALTSALPTLGSTALTAIAPLLDDFVPAGVTAAAAAGTLTVTVGDVSLAWTPATGVARLVGDGVSVPGIEQLSFVLALGDAGLREVTVTVGPAAIDAGGVTLRPFVTVAAGASPEGGRRVAVGMALDDTHRFAARWLLDGGQFALVASDGPVATALETIDEVQVALRIVEIVADLVAAVAMAQQAVQELLDTPVGASNVRGLLRGVVLEDAGTPTALIDGVFDPATMLARAQRLFRNIADASFSVTVAPLTLGFTSANDVVGLQIGLADRMPIVTGDVSLWLENDGSWIDGNTPPKEGLFVGILNTSGTLAFEPTLTVYGVGLRIGKASGPLLDVGITLDSIALHLFAELNADGARSGGVQLQFSNLAVSPAGAGGENGIAQGVLRDSGPTPPKPAFSPAIAIQKQGNAAVGVSLRAGDGEGPWWIAIQRGFGPLYLEQVGFGALTPNGRLERVSLLMDGSVSMFGLTCAVDDLQVTYITANGDLFNPASWAVDLAGLAVSADMAGVSIAGGLLKQTTPQGIEYLGMLLGRFGVYGLTIYGGYGEGVAAGEKFTAFFAVGAVNGPMGGPPAFFLTGIGGGFGINRRLVVPSDLSRFGDYPLIQALDIAASPVEPMAQLRLLGEVFPMQRGTFWFAAGLSFTSFALIDGIAVVAVQIGDGLDINLLGLARMALPRPQVALVSIELALLVRFSSSEGVLWVQGQLTDNSWLLYPDIRLTGGFAYVIWFKGEHRGEFVLTLGGYHPDFHRDGYPQVPRLGLRWSLGSNIVIKAGSYFALTSEALMTGGDFEVSASFGPAWAEVKFGAHGIVFFDPFSYQVNAYARIAAGVTIDTWLFGEITISVSLGARIDVQGPDFRGSATFEVGPIELTVRFGGSDRAQKQPLAADAFVAKYLEAGEDGRARPHAVVTSFGALPAKGEQATPDGSSARPYIVVVEFGLTFTSTVPAASVSRTLAPSGAVTQHPPSRVLGVAPMGEADVLPTITLAWRRAGAAQAFPFQATPRPFGAFPVGVWGAPQDANDRKVPKAEMIEALHELDLACRATPSGGGPEIPYYQVEIGRRKPLPFARRAAAAAEVTSRAEEVAALVTAPATVGAAFDAASAYLRATSTPTARAALRGERRAPPLLGTLTEGIQTAGATLVPDVGATRPGKVYDHFIDPPVAVGLLPGATVDLRVASPARTTVKDSARAWRKAPPTLASVEAERSRSIAARLVVTEPRAVSTGRAGTVIGALDVPPTAIAHGAPAIVARAGSADNQRLAAFSASLAAARRTGRASAAATLTAGETAVLRLPNARRDSAPDAERPRLGITGVPARVVVLALGGAVLADRIVHGRDGGRGDEELLVIARGAERIVAIGGALEEGATPDAGLAGWHAGMQLPYAGWSTAVAPGCVVRSTGEELAAHRERLEAGWVTGAELARGVSTVTTTFADYPTTVVIALDDPAAFGDAVAGRQLLLGLDGADRVRDAAGRERPPVLLTMENRSVLAYDIVPERKRPVVVTIATERGWSLVGVMGSSRLDAAGAIALVSARGLDAAMRPFSATSAAAGEGSRIDWHGPSRTPRERREARARASGRLPAAAPATAKKRSTRKRASRAKRGTRGTR